MRSLKFIIAICLLISSGKIKCQEEKDSIKTLIIGFGVNIEQFGFNQKINDDDSNINKTLMSFTFKSNLRLEGEFGFRQATKDRDYYAIGLNLLVLKRMGSFNSYTGFGFEKQYLNWKTTELYEYYSNSNQGLVLTLRDVKYKSTILKFGFIFGAEYFPVDRFSIGTQIGVDIIVRERSSDLIQNNNSQNYINDSYFSSSLNLLFRFYL